MSSVSYKRNFKKNKMRSDGRNDILTVAIRKHKHPHGVKGVKGGIGIRDYFGVAPCYSLSMVTREEMKNMLAIVRVEVRAEVEVSFDA